MIFLKKIIYSILIIFSGVFLVSCDSRQSLLDKISEVKPEVDYGFTSYGPGGVVINNEYYDFVEMAEKLLGKKCELYPYGYKMVDDNSYFYYQYDSHGSVKYVDDHSYNYKTFDVALVKANITNLTCEIIYKFENVYPVYNFEYVNPNFSLVVDDDRAVVQYNGNIQILDLNNKVITDSIEVYDKDAYRFDGNKLNFYFNSYGDYYIKQGEILHYYELSGYKFKLHEYKINEGSYYVKRYSDYVYTSNSTNTMEYYDCYDLTDDKKCDVNVVLEMLEEEKNASILAAEAPLLIGGNSYYIDVFDGNLNIMDKNKENIICINENYMCENSEIFNQLYDMWDSNHRGYTNVEYYVTDNKLFIGFYAEYLVANHTPMYIYEYDIINDNVKYVGYIDSRGFGNFSIIY